MIVTITNHSTQKEIEAALKKLGQVKKRRGSHKKNIFDAAKYCGVIKLKEDPLATQKRMRNEWE